MVSSIPAVIIAVGVCHLKLSGSLDLLSETIFGLPLLSQISLFAVVFCVISLAISVSNFADHSFDHDHDHGHDNYDDIDHTNDNVNDNKIKTKTKTTKTIINNAQSSNYPLEEISKASTDKEKFLACYPMLRDEMLAHMANNEMPDEAIEWCKTMMDYTVPGGKLNRGVTVVAVHRTLVHANDNGRDLTDMEVAKASVLGWAIEFLQAFFLVADDVMDASKTRRGQPCWYKLDHVKNIAINDSFLLESYVFTMLKKHFGSEGYYLQLLELFLKVIQQTEFGQLLDLTSQDEGSEEIDLTRFTLERYQKIVKYKTAFYTFYLPVAIGMITSGVADEGSYDLAQKICCQMGEYFQIQDDYLDCFGDPSVIGKVGTDIQDNKCSWLVVQALDRVTPEQRVVLEQNYGQWDDEKVANIKALYRELDLIKVFETYEEDSYKLIQSELDKVTTMPRDVFELLLKKIYKRSK